MGMICASLEGIKAANVSSTELDILSGGWGLGHCKNIGEETVQIDHCLAGPMKLATREGFSDTWDDTIFAEPLRSVVDCC
jgi:hypothetical protein